MAAGLREREEIRELFGRQVGADVAKAAMEQGTEMGGETREVAVLFTDIVGSTSLAQDRPPHEVVDMLNEFFAVVVKVVEEHGGWINKFEGDAALAVFGAPIPLDDAADRALAAARALADRLADEVPDLTAGIGVSGGTALAGNVGAEHRFEYTVIGDPVNEAARLTELAKEEDGHVLASCDLVEQASEEEAAHWQAGDDAELRGRSTAHAAGTPGSALGVLRVTVARRRARGHRLVQGRRDRPRSARRRTRPRSPRDSRGAWCRGSGTRHRPARAPRRARAGPGVTSLSAASASTRSTSFRLASMFCPENRSFWRRKSPSSMSSSDLNRPVRKPRPSGL